MMLLTLIPSAGTYGIMIFILLSLGSFSIANLIHDRWLASRGVSIITVNVYIKAFIVIFGVLLMPIRLLFDASLVIHGLSIILGLIAGFLAVLIERIMPGKNQYQHNEFWESSGFNLPNKMSDGLFSKNARTVQRSFVSSRYPNQLAVIQSAYHFGLCSTLLVALFEELIFRGFLVVLCFTLPNPWLITISLSITVLIFGAAHSYGGFRQVVAKTSLGIITLLVTLVTGTVLPAIVAHIYFNIVAYRETGGWLYPASYSPARYNTLK